MNVSLGSYQLSELVSRGGMGHVYRAVHGDTGMPAAVKVIDGLSLPAEIATMLRNEARAMARLDHPNVVLVLDHGFVDEAAGKASGGMLAVGSPYVAMEWASGGVLRRGVVAGSWQRLKAVLRQLLSALGHAHARGVVHRDLKASNVLLCTDADLRPGLKLADFGIALAENADLSEASVGTPSYMAPEQIRADRYQQGPATDLYALGVLVFKLVTGRMPFAGSAAEVFEGHLYGAVPALSPRLVPLPPGFGEWVGRLLRKQPGERYASAADAAWALERLGDAAEHGTIDAEVAAVVEPETLRDLTSHDRSSVRDATTEHANPMPELAASKVRPQSFEAPPMPDDWRGAEPATPSIPRSGAGLSLFRMRPSRLIGRGAERDALWESLRATAESGEVHVRILEGPSGTGKSRLAQWLGERGHEVGAARLLRATHEPGFAATHGLRPMVRRLLGIDRDLRRADIAERATRMLERLGCRDREAWQALVELADPVAEGEAGDGTLRFGSPTERHVSLGRILGWLTRERPLILWLDDAHLGRDSLAFVRSLLEPARASAPILAVLTVKSEALTERPGAAAALDEIAAHARAERIVVGPLPGPERRTLLRELLGLDPAVAAEVDTRTGGNPMFATELLGDWIDRGLLARGPSGYVLCEGANVDLPESLGQVWRERLERLVARIGKDARKAVELAATLGREVDHDEWRRACSLAGLRTPEGVLDALFEERLASTGAEDGSASSWAFVHGMLRETIETAAAEAGRLEHHHRMCAEALRNQRADDAKERRAMHLASGAEHQQAIVPLTGAARRRIEMGDLREAARLLEARDDALSRLRAQPKDRRRTEGWLVWSRLRLTEGRLELARELANRALSAADDGAHAELRVLAAHQLGRVTLRLGELDAARTWLDTAFAQGAELDPPDPNRAAAITKDIGDVLLRSGDVGRAIEHFRLASIHQERAGTFSARARCQLSLGQASWRAGDLDVAREHVHLARDLYERAGSRSGVAHSENALAEIARLGGHVGDAERHYLRALDRYRAIGAGDGVYPQLNLGLLHLDADRFIQARDLLRAGLATLDAQGRKALVGAVRLALAACAAGLEDWPAWDRHFPGALEVLEETGFVDADVARTADKAAALAREAGAEARATAAHELARAQWTQLSGRQ